MRDADLNDIYVDENGKLWRVIAVCRHPTVTVEEVEPSGHSTDETSASEISYQQAIMTAAVPRKGYFIRKRQTGSVDGGMWRGFGRIFRAKPNA